LKVTKLLTKQEFYAIRGNSERPRIVVFVATWCGFCRRFIDLVRNFESKYDEVQLVDADNEGETLWDEYSISTVPTIIVLQDGEEVFRQDGRPMVGLSNGDLERAVAAAVRQP